MTADEIDTMNGWQGITMGASMSSLDSLYILDFLYTENTWKLLMRFQPQDLTNIKSYITSLTFHQKLPIRVKISLIINPIIIISYTYLEQKWIRQILWCRGNPLEPFSIYVPPPTHCPRLPRLSHDPPV